MASTLNASTTLGLISSADTSGVLQLQTASTAAVTINASQNVGIGTASPAYKLDITSASDASLFQIKSTAIANNTAMRFGIDGNNSFINATGGSTGVLQLRTYGTTQATLDASGNLGLGVTPSAWSATWKAFQTTGGSVVGATSNIRMAQNWYHDGTSRYVATRPASMFVADDGVFAWYNAPSGTAGNAITFTQAMTLDASGNLAVGTTNTTYGKANIKATGSQIYSGLTLFSNDGTESFIGLGCTGSVAGISVTYGATGSYLPFVVSTGGSERARIDSSGNLLVGTTTAVEKLTVAGNISISTSGNPFLQIKTSGAGNNPYIRLQADTVTWDIQGTFSNAGDELYLIYAGSNRGYFNSSTGVYVPVSDRNLKKDITDISYGLSAVMALRPVEYLMKTETEGSQKHLGFIAQEAQTAVPSSVSQMTDGMFGMDKTELIAVLVKGMQEQQAQITQLQADIAALKGLT